LGGVSLDDFTTTINIILSVANAVMVATNIYLINRRTKEGFKLSRREQRISILEKSGLSIELTAHNNKEEIKVTNIGQLSIDNIKVDICSLTESGKTLLQRTYLRKDTLLKAGEFIVPLSSILKGQLKEEGKLSFHKNEMGTEFDPDIGREVPIIFNVWYAKNDFSLILKVKTSYQVLGETKTQQDTFRLSYIVDPQFFRDPFVFIDGDNYKINVQRISGEWQ
jgi:hypothetical protein